MPTKRIGPRSDSILTGMNLTDRVHLSTSFIEESHLMEPIHRDVTNGRDDEGAIPKVKIHRPVISPRETEWGYGHLTITEHLWTDAEWDGVPEIERPGRAVRQVGMGWSLITVRTED